MKQFEVGKEYYMRSACDHNCIWAYEVIDRTEKTITIKELGSDDKPMRRKVSVFWECESVKPLGSYSMAPVLSADHEVETKQTQDPEPPEPQHRNNYSLDCGCTVHHKADIHACRNCGKQLCGQHIYSYVDEANAAITKNSPLLCRECYEAKYNKPQQVKPSNVIDITERIKERQDREALAH